ncbi:MAG: riboflavin biosynthesis protein RibD [Phenylobacterium sp.]|nr:riboflavin biosynthesis protein RibD [Phenylobacterium sp.]
MRRAIALAATHVGLTADNPSVGCVIVNGGEVVGEGVTGEGGRPHAEEVALARAGGRARGGVAYVTLEPCARRSAGGVPCSTRLADAGVARVVFACADPSVFAGGHGAQRLSDAGVTVDQGLMAREAAALLGGYAPARPLESLR